MNTNLTKNLRTHLIYIRTLDWNDTETINITKDQYIIISEDIQNMKATDFYKITDVDNWKTLFEWQRKDILRFKERDVIKSDYVAICELWERHNLINWEVQCNCLNKMWIHTIDIYYWLKLLGYDISSAYNITKEMRQKLYMEVRKPDFKERVLKISEETRKEYIKYKKSIDPEYAVNIKFNI